MKNFAENIQDAVELSQKLTQTRGMHVEKTPVYETGVYENRRGTNRKHCGINKTDFVDKKEANRMLRQHVLGL